MKKSILIVAIALVASLGFGSVAQTPVTVSAGQERLDKNKKPARRQKSKMVNPELIAGLNLTAEQMSAIEGLNRQQIVNDSVAREKMRSEHASAGKLRKDAKIQRRAEKQQRRRDYFSKLKGILTPEQYVAMLENVAIDGKPIMLNAEKKHKVGSRRSGSGRQVVAPRG